MTIPFKLPPPARLPSDLRALAPALRSPKLLRESADDTEDDATLLWKRGARSGFRRGSGFATSSAKSFAFTAGNSEEDSTLIKKPNLADPRLLRSDRPPSPSVPMFAQTAEPPCVPGALLAFLTPPPPKEKARPTAPLASPLVEAIAPAALAAHEDLTEPAALTAHEDLTEPMVMSWPDTPGASDWDEVPYSPELTRPLHVVSRGALWGAAVASAALAAVIAVVSNPEQSAVFVERIVASGTALVAFIR
jgi:hypothetical protein